MFQQIEVAAVRGYTKRFIIGPSLDDNLYAKVTKDEALPKGKTRRDHSCGQPVDGRGRLQKPVPAVAAADGPQPRRLAAPHLSRAAVRHLHHWTRGADRPGARHRRRPGAGPRGRAGTRGTGAQDRKSTRLNSSN